MPLSEQELKAEIDRRVERYVEENHNDFLGPISKEPMKDPVILADGHSYEREEITEWLRSHNTSPKTNEELEHTNLIPNRTFKSTINDTLQKLRDRFREEVLAEQEQVRQGVSGSEPTEGLEQIVSVDDVLENASDIPEKIDKGKGSAKEGEKKDKKEAAAAPGAIRVGMDASKLLVVDNETGRATPLSEALAAPVQHPPQSMEGGTVYFSRGDLPGGRTPEEIQRFILDSLQRGPQAAAAGYGFATATPARGIDVEILMLQREIDHLKEKPDPSIKQPPKLKARHQALLQKIADPANIPSGVQKDDLEKQLNIIDVSLSYAEAFCYHCRVANSSDGLEEVKENHRSAIRCFKEVDEKLGRYDFEEPETDKFNRLMLMVDSMNSLSRGIDEERRDLHRDVKELAKAIKGNSEKMSQFGYCTLILRYYKQVAALCCRRGEYDNSIENLQAAERLIYEREAIFSNKANMWQASVHIEMTEAFAMQCNHLIGLINNGNDHSEALDDALYNIRKVLFRVVGDLTTSILEHHSTDIILMANFVKLVRSLDATARFYEGRAEQPNLKTGAITARRGPRREQLIKRRQAKSLQKAAYYKKAEKCRESLDAILTDAFLNGLNMGDWQRSYLYLWNIEKKHGEAEATISLSGDGNCIVTRHTFSDARASNKVALDNVRKKLDKARKDAGVENKAPEPQPDPKPKEEAQKGKGAESQPKTEVKEEPKKEKTDAQKARQNRKQERKKQKRQAKNRATPKDLQARLEKREQSEKRKQELQERVSRVKTINELEEAYQGLIQENSGRLLKNGKKGYLEAYASIDVAE